MPMNNDKIAAVAKILSDWNPLGPKAAAVQDLDGYRVEAIDIIANTRLQPSALEAVRTVLNEAFRLSLSEDDCREAAKRISAVLGE